jgi:hypothetical protein
MRDGRCLCRARGSLDSHHVRGLYASRSPQSCGSKPSRSGARNCTSRPRWRDLLSSSYHDRQPGPGQTGVRGRGSNPVAECPPSRLRSLRELRRRRRPAFDGFALRRPLRRDSLRLSECSRWMAGGVGFKSRVGWSAFAPSLASRATATQAPGLRWLRTPAAATARQPSPAGVLAERRWLAGLPAVARRGGVSPASERRLAGRQGFEPR